MQNKPYWELGLLDIDFKQRDIKEAMDSIYPRAYEVGQCFGICLTIKEKIAANPSKDPVEIVRQVSIKLINSRYLSVNQRKKNQKLLLRTYVNQRLQLYQNMSALKGRSEFYGYLLSQEISYSGSALVSINNVNGGHELLVIKDRKENAYRIFDPNYGLSVAMTLNNVLLQVNVIKRAYGYSSAALEFHYGYESFFKQFMTMLLGLNFSFPNSQVKASKAKPYHIVKVILGEITQGDSKLSAEKIYSDLGEGLVRYIVFSILYFDLLGVKPRLDHKKVHDRLENFGFKKEAAYFRELNLFRTHVGVDKFNAAADKGYEELLKFIQEEKKKINERDPLFYSTKLHRAALSGNVEKVKLLIAYGADVNARDVFGHTPLHDAVNSQRWASSQQKKDVVSLLVKNGAIVFTPDWLGRNAILDAVNPEIKEILTSASLSRQLLIFTSLCLNGAFSSVRRSLHSTALSSLEAGIETFRGVSVFFSSNIAKFCEGLYNKVFGRTPSRGRQI